MLAGNVSSFTFKYKLVEVIDDREGKVYFPPEEHLDQKISETDPKAVAKLAIQYYQDLIREASKFIGG